VTTGLVATVVTTVGTVVTVVVVEGTVVEVVVVVVTTVEPWRVALNVLYPGLDDVTVTVALPLADKPVTTPSAPTRDTEPLVVVAEYV
jgi:hypothetical protein